MNNENIAPEGEEEEVEINTNFIDRQSWISPGHFSFDILKNKYLMSDNEIDLLNNDMKNELKVENTKFLDVFSAYTVRSGVRVVNPLVEAVTQKLFIKGGFTGDYDALRPLVEKTEVVKTSEDSHTVTVNGHNFYKIDNHGNVEFFRPEGKPYKINSKYRTKLGSSLIQSLKLSKKATKGLIIPHIKSTIIEIRKKRDSNDTHSVENKEVMDSIDEDVDVLDKSIKDSKIKIVLKRMKDLVSKNRRDGYVRLTEREFESLDEDAKEVEDTMPLKYKIKEILKEHGVTIVSITLMVGTIISTIAASLAQLAAVKQLTDKSNKEINDKIDDKRLRNK